MQNDMYENGQKVLTPQEQQAASEAAAASAQAAAQTECVKSWTKAYMSDPLHAYATNNQIRQWQDACAQGKQPS